jgi:hypothetical protein
MAKSVNKVSMLITRQETQRIGAETEGVGVQRVADSSLLALWRAAPRHAARYACVADNAAGTAHRWYHLAVKGRQTYILHTYIHTYH